MAFTLASIVREHAAGRPGDEALVCGDTRLTWAQMHEHSSRVANALTERGVKAGDRVAVVAKNTAEFFEIAFGAAKIGAITVGLNWRLAAPELQAILADAGPALLVCDETGRALLPAEVGGMHVIGFGDEYAAWRDAADTTDPDAPVAPADVAYILYSSGTTGLPKGVMITHENLGFSRLMAERGFRMGPGSVHMCPGPQFHIAGAGTGLMTMFFGGRTIVLRDVLPDLMLDTIERERVTHAFMVPAIIQMVIDADGFADRDVSSLQQISYGAAPMTEALLRRAMAALGCEFLGVYGMTETSGTVVTLDPEDHVLDGPGAERLRSVGTPLDWVELQVVEVGGEQEAAPGEVGEIRIRSGQNTSGYWHQPETTANTISDDGWLRTGDGAYRDEAGFVYLKDRIKDMIISGGENVYPAEVENALADHPAISDIAVIGVPHEKWGETVKAVVVLRAGESADAEGIREFARTKVAGYKCPTSVEFVDELPRNPSGKVLKRVLRDRFTQVQA